MTDVRGQMTEHRGRKTSWLSVTSCWLSVSEARRQRKKNSWVGIWEWVFHDFAG